MHIYLILYWTWIDEAISKEGLQVLFALVLACITAFILIIDEWNKRPKSKSAQLIRKIKFLFCYLTIIVSVYSYYNQINSDKSKRNTAEENEQEIKKLQNLRDSKIEDIRTKSISVINSLGVLNDTLKATTNLLNNNFINLRKQGNFLQENEYRKLNAIKEITIGASFLFSDTCVRDYCRFLKNYIEGSEDFKSKMEYEKYLLSKGDSENYNTTRGFAIGKETNSPEIYFEYKISASPISKFSVSINKITIMNLKGLEKVTDYIKINHYHTYGLDETDCINNVIMTFELFKYLTSEFKCNSLLYNGISNYVTLDLDINKNRMILQNRYNMSVTNPIGKLVTINDLIGDTILIRTSSQMNDKLVLTPDKILGIVFDYKNETGDRVYKLDAQKFKMNSRHDGFYDFTAIM